MLPERIKTGLRSTTIANPAILHKETKDAEVFHGNASDYNFERQSANFKNLQTVLQNNGTDFAEIAAAHYPGDLNTNHRFVVSTKDGSLLWHKYVGYAAQSGQNHVYISGRRIKVSRFLQLTPAQQHTLLSEDESAISSLLSRPEFKYLDEADTLWC